MVMRRVLGELDSRLGGVRLIIGEWVHANLFSANVYSVGEGEIVLVDAGDAGDADALVSLLQEFGLRLEDVGRVVVTHSHDDHWGGLTKLLRLVPLTVMVYRDDVSFYRRELDALRGLKEYSVVGLGDGDVVEAEGRRLRVIHTPGHDRGSVCLFDEERRVLFSGDTVFASGTTGSLRSGSIGDLKESLRRLAALKIDIILPGHGNIALSGGSEAIRLALERLSWNDNVPEDAPYWMRARLAGIKRSEHKDAK